MTRLAVAQEADRADRSGRRPISGLPFGAVMATGAASQLTGLAGVEALRTPLLWLTILVAGVAVGPLLVGGHGGHAAPPAVSRFGQFTVPVGLAVIGIGLAGLPGPAALVAAIASIVIAWATTFVLTLTVVVPVSRSRPGLAPVTGVWFIAPAAFLADAVGAATLTGALAPVALVVSWLAVAACAVGVVSYFAGLVAVVARLATNGLAGAPRAAWWIVVGCGGLAADALGAVRVVAPPGALAAFGARPAFDWAALTCWALASIALVPVGVGSLRHLMGVRHLSGHPPWPPAFSTAVYSLGSARIAGLFDLPWANGLARVAAVETLAVWAVTGCLRLGWLVSRLHAGSGRPPHPGRPVHPGSR